MAAASLLLLHFHVAARCDNQHMAGSEGFKGKPSAGPHISHYCLPLMWQEEKNAAQLLDDEDKPQFVPTAYDCLRRVSDATRCCSLCPLLPAAPACCPLPLPAAKPVLSMRCWVLS